MVEKMENDVEAVGIWGFMDLSLSYYVVKRLLCTI